MFFNFMHLHRLYVFNSWFKYTIPAYPSLSLSLCLLRDNPHSLTCASLACIPWPPRGSPFGLFVAFVRPLSSFCFAFSVELTRLLRCRWSPTFQALLRRGALSLSLSPPLSLVSCVALCVFFLLAFLLIPMVPPRSPSISDENADGVRVTIKDEESFGKKF